MTLSRLVLNPRAREVIRDLADCQELHRTILWAFPQAAGSARATFGVLFRVERPQPGTLAVLVQSRERPNWDRLPRGYLLQVDDKDTSESYAAIRKGMNLRFRLRANPTRKIDTKSSPDGTRRNGRRVELRSEDRQLEWLARKGTGHGFEIVSVRTANDVANVRANDEGKSYGLRANGASVEKTSLTFASVMFEGVLRVTDADAFRLALENGIGSAKAYGFGLLSVGPTD